MARRGRKAGFVLGAALCLLACGCNSLGAKLGSFALLCAGNLLLGAFGAVAEYLRFTASEVAVPAWRVSRSTAEQLSSRAAEQQNRRRRDGWNASACFLVLSSC